MKSKAVVLSSLVFSGALAMYAGSAWSQGKSSGTGGSSSSTSDDIKNPQTLQPGDPAARQPGAGNPEPGQTPSGGKSKSDATSTSPSKSKSGSSSTLETTPGTTTGDSIEMDTKPGKGTKSSKDPQTLPPSNPAAREPGSSNPEPGQSRGGTK
jgi:hypothetical protein